MGRKAYQKGRAGLFQAFPSLGKSGNWLATGAGGSDPPREMIRSDPRAEQALIKAAEKGDIGGIRAALAQGAQDANRALIRASAGGHALAVGYLLDHGADIHFALRGGPRPGDPLREAVRNKRVEVVRLLLERGADATFDGSMALCVAVKNGSVQIVRMLLKAGADPGPRGYEALLIGIEGGEAECVRVLLKSERAKGVPSEVLDPYCEEGLRFAVANGNVRLAEAVLDGGADVRADSDGALRRASKKGDRAMALLLLERGANPAEAAKWNTASGKAFLEKLTREKEV
jgi:ankyrin repeat protein